ncbi:MAG: putative signal transducing protein [Bacillota bacterium]
MICPNCNKSFDINADDCPDCIIPLVKKLSDDAAVTVLKTSNLPHLTILKSILRDANIPYVVKGEALQEVFGLGVIIPNSLELVINKENLAEVVELFKAMQEEVTEEALEE